MAKGTVGFYGKLPVVGDFITRRLPKDFINALDLWMQAGVSVSKEELGNNWLDLYLTSPIWRFVFQPGVCGENAWAGIMMPSVDKVGRYYPLTIACKVDQANDLALILAHCNDWFARLEEIALAGLEEHYNLDGFNEVLLDLDSPVLKKERTPVFLEYNDQLSTHLISEIECVESHTIADSLMMAGLHAFSKNADPYSLWLNQGSDTENGSVKIFKGLPTGHDYSVMIG